MKQVLTIAGYDSNGSAGMAADLHTFYAAGVYGMGVLTGVVTENATTMTASQLLPMEFIQQEFNNLAEFKIRATKTGMLATTAVISCVADNYHADRLGSLILDPVIVTKRQDLLLSRKALTALCDLLIPLATVITPNSAESQYLTGQQINNYHDMMKAAEILQQMGSKNVVIKGPHFASDSQFMYSYVLLQNGNGTWVRHQYVKTMKINGTGDSFSAAIAAEIAKGASVLEAIVRTDSFIAAAVRQSLQIGQQFGPLNHWAGQKNFSAANCKRKKDKR